MTKITTELRRIDHCKSLTDYCAMGRKRSLRQLRQRYDGNTTIVAPSFHTLAAWSRKFGWQEEVARYDERVGAKVAQKAEQAAVDKQFDQIAEFTAIIEEGAAVLKDWISDSGNVKKIASATEFGTVSNALVRLTQVVELLSGKPTSRPDDIQHIEPPEWMREQLQKLASVHDDDSETDVSVN